MDETLLVIICVFGAIVILAFLLIRALVGGNKDTKLLTRLSANALHDPQRDPGQQPQQKSQGVAMLQKVGQAAAAPFLPNTREKQSKLRRQLGYAGIYSPSAIKVVTGFKVILLG